MAKRIFLDAFFYLAVPLLLWNLFRENLGDYYAILYGMLPAVIYTVAMAVIKKEWNVTGIFFLSLISLNFIFNLISKTAEQELWNGVYMSIISIVFYVLTILIRKPIGMYFFIDYAYAKGIPRKDSATLYRSPENYGYFVWFTLFLVLREVVTGGIKSFLIFNKGIESFNTIQITSSVIGYVFTGLTVFYVIYIIKKTKK
ncbi:VC0807 family protein [Pseudotenacibaculum sp. MALMAid0570]|uniref:VC0807 family protein n=1 Tax=Pseudotenacibaculum sp. MALMAid0570 TaxID=3143938 RepID=UPI0032DE5374